MKTILTFILVMMSFSVAQADPITGFFLAVDDGQELLDIQPIKVEFTMTERSTYSDQFPFEIREFVFWGEDSVNFAIGTGSVDEPLVVNEVYSSNPLWSLYSPNTDGSNGIWFQNGSVGPNTNSQTQIGTFSVLELELDDFGEVSSIAVNFTQLNEDSTSTTGAMRYNSTVAFDVAVPEPSTASMLLLAFIFLRRKMK